jgi:hypothetical protein
VINASLVWFWYGVTIGAARLHNGQDFTMGKTSQWVFGKTSPYWCGKHALIFGKACTSPIGLRQSMHFTLRQDFAEGYHTSTPSAGARLRRTV